MSCVQCGGLGWYDDGFCDDEYDCDCAAVAKRDEMLVQVRPADCAGMSNDDLKKISNAETSLSVRHPAYTAAGAEIMRRVHLQNDSDATRKAIEHLAVRGLI